MKKFILSSLFMMSIVLLYGQTEGVVIDSFNKPLEAVDVFLVDQKILLKTNEEGEFVTEELSNNSYIHFSKLGYASRLIKYKKGVELQISLEPLHVSLDEVGVTESFSELGNNKLTSIDKKSLKDNLLNSNSMVENITQISGVDMISSGLGIQKVVVRGLSGLRVVTYLNGMKVENQQWANDHGIGFTDLGLSEVELIKGASALKYGGEAVGGLLYFKDNSFVSSKKLNGYLATKFDYSNFYTTNKFGVNWSKNNFYFNLHAQYAISSDYKLPSGRYLKNSRFEQNAIKFSLAHKYKNLQNIFRYQLHNEIVGIPAHLHTNDPASADINSSNITTTSLDFSEAYSVLRPNQFVKNQLFTYKINYFFNDLKLSIHAGHFINNLEEWEKTFYPAFDLTISNTQITPNIRYQNNDLTIAIGSQISKYDNKNNYTERLVPDASSVNIGAYAIFDYEKEDIGYNIGIRHDYKNMKSVDALLGTDFYNEFSFSSYSAGLYYDYKGNIFRATYSGAFRSPHFSELFSDGVHHGTNRYEIGSTDLGIEYSNQFDLKYQWSNDHFGLVINPFIQYIQDFITIVPTNNINSGYRVYNYTQYDEVELRGLEMNLHYHPHLLHNLHLEQSYSFLQTKNKEDDFGLPLTPANSIRTKAILDLKQYNRYLDNFLIHHLHKFKQDSYAEYEELTEAYNVINLRLGIRFNSKIKSSLAINNLMNEQYSPHTSRVRGVAGGIPNPGRSYNISLKYEF